MMNERIKFFLHDNWKFCLFICLFTAFFIIFMINYIGKEEKRVTEPKTVNYDDSTNSRAMEKQLNVNPGESREITRQIERIHAGEVPPTVTYTVDAPNIYSAAEKTAKQIKEGDATLPEPALEKTDRTAVTADPKKQVVDVYKINLKDNHKIKAGVMTADGKAYVGIGYQAGRFEGMAYTREGRKIDAAAVTYTIKQW
jgi:type IV secretory pathway VirB10-like protein